MLIPVELLARLLRPTPSGVIHVGAHSAEELDAYRSAGWSPRVWVEALPDLAQSLRERLRESDDDLVVEGAVWSVAGEVLEMHRASNIQSSSLLPPAEHLLIHPGVRFVERVPVSTLTLDDVVRSSEQRFGTDFDLLVLDIQGAELQALTGLTHWTNFRWVYSEVSVRELYSGQPRLADVDALLGARGFRRVATLVLPGLGWGDALYARKDAWAELPTRSRVRLRSAVLARRLRTLASLVRDLLTRRGRSRSAVSDVVPQAASDQGTPTHPGL